MFKSDNHAGQSLVEYALLIVLVAGTLILALNTLGISLLELYCLVAGNLGLDASCGHFFYDDFDSLDAWDIDKGKWQIQGGQLRGGPGEGRIYKDIQADDYTITLNSATLEKGNGYGVFFRASNAPKVNGYSFQYDPGYQAFIYRKWVNGYEINPPFAVAKANSYDWWGDPKTIQIKVQGDTFTTYVDGQPVLQATDRTYDEGGIGLRTWNGTTSTFGSISVDDVR